MTELTLLRPLWLLMLPALALAGWRLWRRQGRLGDWDRVADPGLLQLMAALGRIDAQASRTPLLAGLLAAAAVSLALAGPAVERRDTPSFRNLDGVVFVVDASDSVTLDPGWPAMQVMGRFALEGLGTRPAGIIAFAGDAYEVAEMTLDHVQLGQTFSLIGQGLVPDPGSRPGRALDLAAGRLAKAEVVAGDVVLFTDGGGLGPDALVAAAAIAAEGARLSVVPLSTSPAAETLAATGGGRVFTPAETEALGDWLAEDARTRLERQDYPLLFWHDLGRWLLALALIPLAALFRRAPA